MAIKAFLISASLIFTLVAPGTAFAADGSGTNTVLPVSVTAGSTGNTLNFTFTAAESMNMGDFTIKVPSDWSTPNGTVGTPGYTTVTSGGANLANILDTADTTSTWSAGTGCDNGLSATTTVKQEGAASIACRTGDQSTGDNFYNNITAQDWSGYTTIKFWIRTSVALGANNLRFAYDNDPNIATPIVRINLPAISANTWTLITLTLSGARTSVASYGFNIKHNGALDNAIVYVDDLRVGPGSLSFPGGVIKADLLSIATGTTVIVSYGNGGGASGAAAPPTGRANTFITQSRTADTGTYTTIASSPTVTVNNPVPTLTSISPTTKNTGDSTFSLTLNGTNFNASSTAYFSTSTLSTTYVSSTQLTASVPGSLLTAGGAFNITVANPTPGGGTSTAQVLTVVDTIAPTIVFTAPTKNSNADITDTTIHVTDNTSILAASVVIATSTTAGTNSFNCTQTNGTTVDCTITITSSGDLTIKATDASGNISTSSSVGYDIDLTLPSIIITNPTLISTSTITDTTIHVTDADQILAASVVVDPSTTAGTSGLSCSQTNSQTVDCTINITSSGDLVIKASDIATNSSTQTATGYVIDATFPVISITAPTTSSTTDITDTTIHVTDADDLLVVNVIVDPSTTAFTSNYICTQTDSKTVDCTIEIDTTGDLVIKATDRAGNVSTSTQSYTVNSLGPTIAVTTPTKTSSTTIMDTTIHVTDPTAVLSSDVLVDPSTTAGTSGFSCLQTDPQTVDCTINITSSGNLVLTATNGTATTTDTISGYVIETTPPVIAFTAPTKTKNTTITDTTIRVTDNNGVKAIHVLLSPSTTAGTNSFFCVHTNDTTVDCTIDITSSGDVTINATDDAGNISTSSSVGYVIDLTLPSISFTAPAKTSSSTITNTTIHVTDGGPITASNVVVDPSTTAGTSGLSCSQTDSQTVDCTINITSSGDLVIKATDDATNARTETELGYVIETTAPVITITAPTKTANSTISDTTITVTDDFAISSIAVSVSGTATPTGLSCINTSSTQVDCTVNITSSGDLVVDATDVAGNPAVQTSETGYVIETTAPVISITAPTKTASSTISDTTIQVTDDTAISSSTVSVAASTAGTANLACIQTTPTQVDCTIDITSSGDLIVDATDVAGNPAVQTTEANYIVDATPPIITITAPTLTSSSTISNTTIQVTNTALTASNVTLDGATTAGFSNFSCAQTSSAQVDCTIDITSSGDLVIAATDDLGNSGTSSQTGYVIDTTAPVIVITAPTHTSSTAITDTTIQVTDDLGITASNVSVGASTAGTANLNCSQTSSTQVDCTIDITSSGDLVVDATDDAGNSAVQSETGYVISGAAPSVPTSGGSSGPAILFVQVNQPSAGAALTPGATQTVSWTIGGTARSVDISLSTDGGTIFSPIASGLYDSGSYAWIVPNIAASIAKIRITANGASGQTGTGDSGPFSITGTVQPTPPSGPATPPTGGAPGEPSPTSASIDDDKGLPVSGMTTVLCRAGSLIKGSQAAVYYCANDGKRYVFPNEKVYFTWYADFSGVLVISDAELAAIPVGGNVTYRPGSRLVKITTDPKVYAVYHGGILRWVTTEDLAASLYGPDWNTKIDDISDAFFVNYTVGTPITSL